MSVYQSAPTLEQAAITAKDFNFWYGDFHALTGLDLNIAKNAITSFIGPSGCGKSTFLRCINRMNDLIEGTRVEGTMTLDGNDIYAEGVDPVDLRRRVGMIFQQPNPFPKSIYENVGHNDPFDFIRCHPLCPPRAHAKPAMVNDGTQTVYASPKCALTSAARRRDTGTVEVTRSSLSSIRPVEPISTLCTSSKLTR